MTKAGKHYDQESRVRWNLLVDNSGLVPIYVLRKDHKPFDVTVGGPPGRPVCGASAGYNAKLSHHISTIIRPV